MPEFAAAADGVSLLMPAVEPYVAKAVRAALVDGAVPASLRADAERYVREELAHQRDHHRHNARVIDATPSLARVDRVARRSYRWLAGRPLRTGLAHAAAFEAVAFCGARWTEPRIGPFFGADADPDVAGLYVWHLAEEVEHSTVAWDVFRATGGRRRSFLLHLLIVLVVLGAFTTWAAVLGVIGNGAWRRPVAWLRLLGWAVGFAFTALPLLAQMLTPGHHPTDLRHPDGHRVWLDRRAQDAVVDSRS